MILVQQSSAANRVEPGLDELVCAKNPAEQLPVRSGVQMVWVLS